MTGNEYLGHLTQQEIPLRDAPESLLQYLRGVSSMASALTEVRAKLHQREQALQRIGQCDDLEEIHRMVQVAFADDSETAATHVHGEPLLTEWMIRIIASFLQVKQACAPLAQRGDIVAQQGQLMVEALDAFSTTITALCHAVKRGVLPINSHMLFHLLHCIEARAAELADDLDAALPALLVAHKNPHRRRYLYGLLKKLEQSLEELHHQLTDEHQRK